MQPTQTQIQRVTDDWSRIAGETVAIEYLAGALYAWCSELAALRLFHKMPRSGRAAFSANRGSWYFCVELLSQSQEL